ncbi:unnamed protein product, partial [Gongylonema pulchrum]|uniref:LRAT domain-containing protein n=1 Tax=Gongylonema pulchrum TaxID=637853 RepID=A0A183DJ74_9BILA
MSLCWNKTFLKMTSSFQKLCHSRDFEESYTPVLQSASDGFFMNDCLSAALGVEIVAIHHGNLVNSGTFLSHFSRYSPTEELRERRCAALLSALSPRTTDSAMTADFEHDCNQFVVRVAVLDGGLFSVFL